MGCNQLGETMTGIKKRITEKEIRDKKESRDEGEKQYKEGFLFDAEEIGKQETDTQTSEGTESTDAPRRRGRKRSMVTEDRPPLTPEQMRELLEGITEIETATGIRYIRIHLTAKMLIGIRESSGKEFTINLGELYQAYQKCLRFTSPEVKRIIFMGHSPAVTLLRMLKEKAQNLS